MVVGGPVTGGANWVVEAFVVDAPVRGDAGSAAVVAGAPGATDVRDALLAAPAAWPEAQAANSPSAAYSIPPFTPRTVILYARVFESSGPGNVSI